MLTLLVLQGPDKGRRFELPDVPTLIGRDSRQLPITDKTVSRKHCELIPTDQGNWDLKDLGSANGSYINGTRVARITTLKLGDQIRVGRTLMLFGAQPGISRSSGGDVDLADEAAGMDSAILNTIPASDDSMVLAFSDPGAAAVSSLKILYELSAALGSAFDVESVLEVVMDLVFEHIKADRGIIMLLDEKRQTLIPKVVRTRQEAVGTTKPPQETAAEPTPKIHASRTIINYVLANSQGVLSSNAMADRRFSKGKSVHDLGIRSALCVPIKARKMGGQDADEIVGVIYVDSSVKNYTYSPEQLRLLNAIGIQAGMAMQNAHLYRLGLNAERMAAIGETTAALSHSIKNILQALRGGADVVEIGFRNSNLTQASKGWRIVERNLEKIYHLTLNLLAYSKEREPRLELVNPKTLIDDCIELTASAANDKSVMVVADVEKDHPAIPMDPDGIHQVLMNLLSNALDAVEPAKGLIRVVCRYQEREGAAVIQVIDNGSGIAQPMRQHLFELFHSTKGNRGTGLGLAVARKIVEEHDGSISVDSTPGNGTVFTVRLPVQHVMLADAYSTHGPAK